MAVNSHFDVMIRDVEVSFIRVQGPESPRPGKNCSFGDVLPEFVPLGIAPTVETWGGLRTAT